MPPIVTADVVGAQAKKSSDRRRIGNFLRCRTCCGGAGKRQSLGFMSTPRFATGCGRRRPRVKRSAPVPVWTFPITFFRAGFSAKSVGHHRTIEFILEIAFVEIVPIIKIIRYHFSPPEPKTQPADRPVNDDPQTVIVRIDDRARPGPELHHVVCAGALETAAL